MLDGTHVLAHLRRRTVDSNESREIWKSAVKLCKPCEYWFPEPIPVEEVFPLDLLPRATKARCFALELEDGIVHYGAYRRRLTNPPRMTGRD